MTCIVHGQNLGRHPLQGCAPEELYDWCSECRAWSVHRPDQHVLPAKLPRYVGVFSEPEGRVGIRQSCIRCTL